MTGVTALPVTPEEPSRYVGHAGYVSKSVIPGSGRGRPVTEADPTTADDFDAERAAIIEYDGGIPRVRAEAFARMQHRRPADMTEAQWRREIDDAGRFLDDSSVIP